MKRYPVCLAVGSFLLSLPCSADVVTDWNDVLLSAIRVDRTAPPHAARAMAMMHGAAYDAVMSIDQTHNPYFSPYLSAPADTSREAAAARAACDVLSARFPAQAAAFNTALTNSLAGIPDGEAKTNGIALGQAAATRMLNARANDGSAASVDYTPGTNPGDWQPTGPTGFFLPALLPQWPQVTPFSMTSGAQFRPPAPPALTSAQYTAVFNEVKDLGAVNSSSRTPEQTEIARFWADGGGTETPPGHWLSIAAQVGQAQGNELAENARMLALVSLAVADAGIVSWDAKYQYNHWRPWTGIREADTDGNPDTIQDVGWEALITTPPFPAYTSGHSTFSGASSAILAAFFGTDDIGFTTDSDGLASVLRSFTSFSDAAEEAGQSRIYGGIHWQYDNQYGLLTGRDLAEYVFETQLTPVPEPSSILLLGVAAGLVRPNRRRS